MDKKKQMRLQQVRDAVASVCVCLAPFRPPATWEMFGLVIGLWFLHNGLLLRQSALFVLGVTLLSLAFSPRVFGRPPSSEKK